MKVPVRPTPALRPWTARVKHCPTSQAMGSPPLLPAPWAVQAALGWCGPSPAAPSRGTGGQAASRPAIPNTQAGDSLQTSCVSWALLSPPSLCTSRTLVPHALAHRPLLPSPRAEPYLQCTRVGPASLVLWMCSRTSSLKVMMEVVDSGMPWSGHAV